MLSLAILVIFVNNNHIGSFSGCFAFQFDFSEGLLLLIIVVCHKIAAFIFSNIELVIETFKNGLIITELPLILVNKNSNDYQAWVCWAKRKQMKNEKYKVQLNERQQQGEVNKQQKQQKMSEEKGMGKIKKIQLLMLWMGQSGQKAVNNGQQYQQQHWTLHIDNLQLNSNMAMRSQRIRDKFRQEIRARQISQIMKITRERAVHDCKLAHIFNCLDKKVRHSANSTLQMQLVQELLVLLDDYPTQENTYIIIGNFLLTHPSAHPYFQLKMLSTSQLACKLENYGWAFVVMLTRSQQFTDQSLKEYDETLSHILRSKTGNLGQKLNLLYLLLTLQNNDSRYYPQHCCKYFLQLISQINVKQQTADTQYLIIAITHNLCQNHLTRHLMGNNVAAIIRVLVLGISDYCKFRQQFLCFVAKIATLWIEPFQEVFNTDLGVNTANQLFYMYENLVRERGIILQIFQIMIQQFSFPILLQLLGLGLHLTIAQTIKTQPSNPQHISKSLQLINMLLSRVQQKQQIRTLNLLLNSLQQHHFEVHLTRLMQERQDPQVEKFLTELIDDFYSEQQIG